MTDVVGVVLLAALVSTILFVVFNLWFGGLATKLARDYDPFPKAWRG